MTILKPTVMLNLTQTETPIRIGIQTLTRMPTRTVTDLATLTQTATGLLTRTQTLTAMLNLTQTEMATGKKIQTLTVSVTVTAKLILKRTRSVTVTSTPNATRIRTPIRILKWTTTRMPTETLTDWSMLTRSLKAMCLLILISMAKWMPTQISKVTLKTTRFSRETLTKILKRTAMPTANEMDLPKMIRRPTEKLTQTLTVT